MNTMSYKGYAARIDYDAEDEIFFAGLRALPTASVFTPIR